MWTTYRRRKRKRWRQLLFSCNVSTHLSSDNLSGDGLWGKLGPEASNVPAYPWNQHDWCQWANHSLTSSLSYSTIQQFNSNSENEVIFEKMLIQDISRFRQFLPLSIFRDLIKTLSCYIFCKLNYSKLRQSLWVTKLTRKSPPHSCKQCNTSSWLVPPPLNTLEQAMFIKSSTEKKKRKFFLFFFFK